MDDDTTPITQDELLQKAESVVEEQAHTTKEEKKELKQEIKEELKKEPEPQIVEPPTEQIDQAVTVLQEVQPTEDDEKVIIAEQIDSVLKSDQEPSAPVVVEQPAPQPEPTSPIESVLPEQAKTPSTSTPSTSEEPSSQVSDRVSQLTHEELEAASRIINAEHLAIARSKSLQARKEKETNRLDAVQKFISSHKQSTLTAVARELNLTPSQAENYVQKLVKASRIRATGHAQSRRYQPL